MARVAIPDSAAGNPFGYVLGHYAPTIGAAGGGFANAVYQSSRLPLRLLEAARYRTAQINGCMVCQSMRAAKHVDQFIGAGGGDISQSIVARGGTAPDEHFYASVERWRDSDCFSDCERLALEHSERMAEDPRGFAHDEAYWTRLHAAFSDDEIVDLTLCVGAWMAMGRVTHILELDTVSMDGMLAA